MTPEPSADDLRARRLRRWKMVGGVLLLVLTAWGAPRLARRLEFFRVRRLEFVGMQHLERGRAVTVLALGPKASVFDDVTPLEQRLFAVPGVKAVTIGRRLPGTLVVELEEWVPVALAPTNGQLALVDRTGRVLPFDPTASSPDLPVVPVADRAVATVLANVQAEDPALFAEIGTAWRAGADVVLAVRDRRIWFGPRVSVEEIRAVMAVAHDLAQRGRSYVELDGRFAGQVIVRGLQQGAGA